MLTAKQQTIELISALPDDCTVEDIHYHLYVREQVERGMRAVESGDVIPQEEMEQEFRRWLQSFGLAQHETNSKP